MTFRLFAMSTVCVLIGCTTGPSQTVSTETTQAEAEKGFVPPEGVSFEKNVQVTMRDGIRLNTHVLLPDEGRSPVATILIRTPYKTELDRRSGLPKRLLEEGYAIVHQHERGRYFSEGKFKMLGGAVNDGWDTMDWIVAQDWSDGSVGTLGCSSSGENQLKLASVGHPAHKAMVAQSVGVGIAEAGPFKEQGNFWRGGVWQQGWFDYFLKSMFQDWPQLPQELSNEERQRLIGFFNLKNDGWAIPKSAFNETRMHLPMIEIMEQMDAPRNEVEAYLRAGPSDASWSENRISEGEMISVPGFWMEAVYDLSGRSTLAFFEWNRQANKAQGRDNQVMRVTQGGHCSFGYETETETMGDLELGDMRFSYSDDVVEWFDRWLKPDDLATPTPTPPAYTAYLGDGNWLETDKFKMSGGDIWQLGTDNTLTKLNFSRPAVFESGMITYQYDPNDPVPSLGGEIGGTGDDHEDGSFDQRDIEARDDVILFTTEPLDKDIDVFGLAEVGLSVSSNRPDTDFTVKFVDVYPDGRAFNIGDTITRMRYREGLDKEVFMKDGEVYNISLPPVLLSRTLKQGHKLRIEVSSSNFPNYARNLNTALDPYTSTDTAIATNTLHIGGGHRSFISLPVVSKNDED